MLLKCVVFLFVGIPRRDVGRLAHRVAPFGALRLAAIAEIGIGKLTVRPCLQAIGIVPTRRRVRTKHGPGWNESPGAPGSRAGAYTETDKLWI